MSQEPKAPEPGTVATLVDARTPLPTSADAPLLFLPPSFDKFRGPLPRFLYHYTGLDGLLGIVEKSELWATNVNYMNDATEFRIALKMTAEKLSKEANYAPSNSQRKQTACTLKKEITHIEERRISAICFCSNGDLLSQWRGYSGRSYGFSVGFNPESLKHFGPCLSG
jgi:hypothetical protein